MTNNLKTIHLIIPGTPIAKGRPKVAVRGKFATVYTPEKTRKAEESLLAKIIAKAPTVPWECPIKLTVLAVFGIPESYSAKKKLEYDDKFKTTKPDYDNILKIFDSMNEVFFKDDAQIVQCYFTKIYGNIPRLEITLEELPDKYQMPINSSYSIWEDSK